MILFYILFAIIVIAAGGFCFLKVKSHELTKFILKYYSIMLVLPVFDVCSTILFTSKLGICYEGNLFAREILSRVGNVGFIILYLYAIAILFSFLFIVLFVLIKSKKRYDFETSKFLLIFLIGMLAGLYCFVVINNLMGYLYY